MLQCFRGISKCCDPGQLSLENDRDGAESDDDDANAVIDFEEGDSDAPPRLGLVWTWGFNRVGQLGHGDTAVASDPTIVDALKGSTVVLVSCGDQHTAVVTDAGRLLTFGGGVHALSTLGRPPPVLQSGNNALAPLSVPIPGDRKVVRVACGRHHTIVLTSNGDVLSWGVGKFGRLGHGDHHNRVAPTVIRALVGRKVVLVAAGGWHSAVILEQGQVCTFGWSHYGQTGHGDSKHRLSPAHVSALRDSVVTKVTCGRHTTFALTKNGAVYGFGSGKYGCLGLGTMTNRDTPQLVESFNGKRVTDIGAGAYHTAVITAGGSVWTFGYGYYGQLGHGDRTHQGFPRLVRQMEGKDGVEVVCGLWHTVVRTASGTLWSFGDGTNAVCGTGTLPDGTYRHQYLPKRVKSLDDIHTHAVASGACHVVALT